MARPQNSKWLLQHEFLVRAIETWPSNPGKALLRAKEIFLLNQVLWDDPVLDFGCGDGSVTALNHTNVKVGLDLSFDKCQIASQKDFYQIVINADGKFIPFANSYFRVVLSNSVLEHVNDLEQVLQETIRVLRPGGILAFTVPSPQKPKYLFYNNKKLYANPEIGQLYIKYFNRYWNHINYLNPVQWKQVLEKVGYSNILTKYYEPKKSSRLIDLLRSIKIKYEKWNGFPLDGNFTEEAWKLILYEFLLPYVDLKAPSSGAGIFIRATKAEKSYRLKRNSIYRKGDIL